MRAFRELSWKYALGELFIVFVGILGAVQVDRWNEHRGEEAALHVYWDRILVDLDADESFLEGLTKGAVLQAIVKGIVDASPAVQKAGGVINPATRGNTGLDRPWTTSHGQVPIVDVEFDVAVTASQSEGSGAGLSVVVGLIGGAARTKREAGDEQVSRLRWTVPLALPPGAKPNDG